ncbi:hypothetical protein MGG_15707 [Pyricularia oryzae 70-15]|uniref:Uncharacterized protein n=3 Tax=Pyricularia oryzae TaxID=318829 RepID=G4MSL2_PYRO7|nr:uncharacterized protein MGG_15707 [Pyricularia oryzae 70-15]EHA54628.1 hypothetical protein MGG_15707 [Pyricularia oryzae 70-15]
MSGSAVRDYGNEADHDGRFSGPCRALDSPVGLSTTSMHSCLAGVCKFGRGWAGDRRYFLPREFRNAEHCTSGNPGKYLKYIAGGEDTAGNRCCATTLVACTPPIGCPSGTAQTQAPSGKKASKGIIVLVNVPLEGVALGLASSSPMPKDAIIASDEQKQRSHKALLHIERQQSRSIDELIR